MINIMGFKSVFKKAGKTLAKAGKSVVKTVKGPIGAVARDAKSAIVWGAKTGVGFAESFTPGGIAKAFSSTGGIGLLTVAGIFGIGAILLLSNR